MLRKLFLGKASLIAILVVLLGTGVSFGAEAAAVGEAMEEVEAEVMEAEAGAAADTMGAVAGVEADIAAAAGAGADTREAVGAEAECRAGSFGSVAPSHAFSGSQFSHAGNFAGSRFGGRDFGNEFNRGFDRFNRFSGFGYGGWGWGGGWWPWWGLGSDWGYPYDYGYSYPYIGDYYYSYAPSDYGVVADSDVTAPQQVMPSGEIAATTSSSDESAEALQYYSEARTAFLEGDYRNALRFAEHAGVDAPGNSKVHELISLALFALGQYAPRPARRMPRWPWARLPSGRTCTPITTTSTSTRPNCALEKATQGNPKDAADRFLLGYHYLMTGVRNDAKTEFADAVKLTPRDKLASHYLQQLQSNAPLTPPQIPQTATRPQGKPM